MSPEGVPKSNSTISFSANSLNEYCLQKFFANAAKEKIRKKKEEKKKKERRKKKRKKRNKK